MHLLLQHVPLAVPALVVVGIGPANNPQKLILGSYIKEILILRIDFLLAHDFGRLRAMGGPIPVGAPIRLHM